MRNKKHNATNCRGAPAHPQPCALQGVKSPLNERASICWHCANAVPGSQRGCSWSRYFIPVENWEATKGIFRTADPKCPDEDTYTVHKCPQFTEEEKRIVLEST